MHSPVVFDSVYFNQCQRGCCKTNLQQPLFPAFAGKQIYRLEITHSAAALTGGGMGEKLALWCKGG